MSVADHHIVPGKKFLDLGQRPARPHLGQDPHRRDGPYIELMVGAYSDNQPDYSWLQPYETNSFSMNWYPFRDIGGVKKANLDAAVNLEVANGTAKVGFYTTSAHAAATVMLKAGTEILLQETVAINPGKPYIKQVPSRPASTSTIWSPRSRTAARSSSPIRPSACSPSRPMPEA